VVRALETCLSDPTKDPTVELGEAYRKISGAYNFVHRMIRLFYNPHSLTWAQAGADGERHKDHESAMAAGHYMLSGDFFENYDKFDGFFQVLENPDNFRRYKKLVIDRDDFVRPSCSSKWEEVFRDMIQRDTERSAELAPV
jgi:hypothetical protein